MDKERNQAVAEDIVTFLIENDLFYDLRIYFNDMAIDSNKGILEDIKGSTFFEFANDDTVSMSFEGPFYRVMNLGFENETYASLENQFSEILEHHGFYYELGYAWSLSLYDLP